MNDLSTEQLTRLLAIQRQIEKLQAEKRRIMGAKPAANPAQSAAARKKISKALKARWATAKAAGKKRL